MPVTPSAKSDLTPLPAGRARMSRGRLLIGIPIVLLGFLLMGISPAAAHSELESTIPAADSSVTNPVTSVSLTFDDGVQPGFAQIAVLDPSGNDIADGEPTIDGDTVTQPIAEAAAGNHSVSYRIVSADGHTVQGSYAFTVAAAVKQPAAPTSGATASTAPTTVSPSQAVASPAAESTEDEGSTGQTAAIAVVLAVGVVATAAITLARRRHRRG